MTVLTTLLAVHVVAFGALYFLSRHDAILVDDAGLPMTRPEGWHEQVIPAAQAAEDAARV